LAYRRKTHITLLVLSLLFLPLTARATNGYWAHGYGTKSKAMAGAGAALPLDAMDAAQNPAKMVFLGNRLDFGVALSCLSGVLLPTMTAAAAATPPFHRAPMTWMSKFDERNMCRSERRRMRYINLYTPRSSASKEPSGNKTCLRHQSGFSAS
jgi:hypothetical protein